MNFFTSSKIKGCLTSKRTHSALTARVYYAFTHRINCFEQNGIFQQTWSYITYIRIITEITKKYFIQTPVIFNKAETFIDRKALIFSWLDKSLIFRGSGTNELKEIVFYIFHQTISEDIIYLINIFIIISWITYTLKSSTENAQTDWKMTLILSKSKFSIW